MASDSALKASSIHCAAEYQNGSFDATVNSASSRRADAMLLSTQPPAVCEPYKSHLSPALRDKHFLDFNKPAERQQGELHKIKAFHYTPCGYKHSEHNGFFSLLL